MGTFSSLWSQDASGLISRFDLIHHLSHWLSLSGSYNMLPNLWCQCYFDHRWSQDGYRHRYEEDKLGQFIRQERRDGTKMGTWRSLFLVPIRSSLQQLLSRSLAPGRCWIGFVQRHGMPGILTALVFTEKTINTMQRGKEVALRFSFGFFFQHFPSPPHR